MTRWKISSGLALLPALFPVIFLWPALTGRFVPSFRDQSDFFLPSHLYTAARISRHELPLWNSLAGNGETWIGNGQNEIFYPPALLFLLKNPGRAAGTYLMLHFVVGYFLAFAFLRERGSTRPACVASASLFAYSALAVSLSAYWNHFAGMVWIPGLAASAQRGLRTRKQNAAFAACLGLTLLAGSPESAAFAIAASAVIFFFGRRQDLGKREEEWNAPVRSPGDFVFAAAAGGALGAVELFPMLETLTRSARRGASASAILLPQLLTLVRPPSTFPYPWLPQGASYLQSLYVSLPILILIGLAFSLRSHRAERFTWLAVAGGSLLFALSTVTIPFRYPAKVLILALVALSVLASEGVDALRFASDGRRRALGILLAGSTLVAAALIGTTAIERASLAAAGLFFGASIAGSSGFRSFVAALGAVALALHLALSASPLVRFGRLATFESPPLPTRGKLLTSPDELLSSWATSALPDEDARVRRQIESLEGYSNLPFGVPKATTGSALPSRESRRFMSELVGRSDFLVSAIVSGSKEIRFPRGGGLAHVIVPKTLAGASFFSEAELESDSAVALARATAWSFEPFRRILVERIPQGAPTPKQNGGGRLAIGSTVSESPERIDYKVNVSENLWMYRAQSWDPWWRVTVDGKTTPIVRANGVFSAIVVPAGEHRVVWEYRPGPFYAGAAVSTVAILVLLFLSLAGEPILRTRKA